MNVAKLTEKDFETKVLKSKMPVMVDFYADWCGPCKQVAPMIEELAGEYKDKMVIYKVNVDEEQGLAGKHGVMSIPTVVMFKDGKEVDRLMGFRGKEGYEEIIEKVI